ncbi:hypothetical protein B0H10DRAFT_1960723 [Mycena sp. CBHHK59/15]|nr:hypothetical protein B0H10DRAFT_1960723 [Mycena sp. CBHHK59/15]
MFHETVTKRHWYMPTWQRELLKTLAHDKNIVKSRADSLQATGQPLWPATSVDMAEFLQFNKVDARGCPYNDSCWMLNLHLVRRLLTFEALMPLKPDFSVPAVAAAYSCLQKGLIYNFVDTGFYARTTSINSWEISCNGRAGQI